MVYDGMSLTISKLFVGSLFFLFTPAQVLRNAPHGKFQAQQQKPTVWLQWLSVTPTVRYSTYRGEFLNPKKLCYNIWVNK